MDVVTLSHALGDPSLPSADTIRDGVRASSTALNDTQALALARAAVDTIEGYTNFAGCSEATDDRSSVIIVKVAYEADVHPLGLWRPATDVDALAQWDGSWSDATLSDYPAGPLGERTLPAGTWRLTGTIDDASLLEGAGLEAIVRVASVLYDIAPGSPTPGSLIRAANAAPLLTRWVQHHAEAI